MRRLTQDKLKAQRPNSFSGFTSSQRSRPRVSAPTWVITIGLMLIGTWMRNDAEEGSDATRRRSSRSQDPTPAQILSSVEKTPRIEIREEPDRQTKRRSRSPRPLLPPRVELDFSHILDERLSSPEGPFTSHAHHGNGKLERTLQADRLRGAGMHPSRDIQIRKEGRRRLVDARIPLNQLRPGTPGNHLIHVQGELRVEGHGTQERIYFEPSLIDGMAPPPLIREKIRRTDISHLIGNTDF